MHFPGSAVDRDRAGYEARHGSRFPCPEWWTLDEDQYLNAMNVVPSRELDGDGVTLWKRMLEERDARLRDALTPAALSFAAETQFRHWQADPRYRPV